MADLSFVFGLAAVLGYAVAVVAGVPLSLVALAALVGGVEDPFGGVPAAATVAVVLALVWGVPLFVGRSVLVRAAGLDGEGALYYALCGLPVGLLGSLIVAVAPGGFGRYNLLFLNGAAALVAWTAFLAVLAFAPALVRLALARRGRRREGLTVA
jgi:hypothetical protein